MVLVLNEKGAARLNMNIGTYATKESEVSGSDSTYTVFDHSRAKRGIVLSEAELEEKGFAEQNVIVIPPEAKLLRPAEPNEPLEFELLPVEGFDEKVCRVEPRGYVQSREQFEEEYKAFIASLGHDVSVPVLYR